MLAVEVLIMQGELPPACPWRRDGAGALVVFDGVVRPTENDQAIAGLSYEAYQPLTSQMLDELGRSIVAAHGLIALRAEHSVGFVANHGVSFRLYIASAHRKEALAAMDQFIDQMKAKVPLWKVPQKTTPSPADAALQTTTNPASHA